MSDEHKGAAEALAAVDTALVALADSRMRRALDEQARGRDLAEDGELKKSQLAHDYAWALRNQADGIWEAAALVRDMYQALADQNGEHA